MGGEDQSPVKRAKLDLGTPANNARVQLASGQRFKATPKPSRSVKLEGGACKPVKAAKAAEVPKAATDSAVKPAREPAGWREIYGLIQEMRTVRDAPVDFFGSEALPQRHISPEVFRYQVLIALMLSSQTKDETVAAAMGQLQQHGLTIPRILQTSAEELDAMICKVGFHNNKTKYIKLTTQILHEKHGGDVPASAKELMALPGIGPKMAFIILDVAHDIRTGIGIDTHMHRIMNQLRWVNTKTPEQTRVALESWLPVAEWGKVNVLFVGFGQHLQRERVKLLLKAARLPSTAAAALGLVVRLGVPLDVRDNSKEGQGRTALMVAAAEGEVHALQALLAAGAKGVLAGSDGKTALNHAVWEGHSHCAQILMAHGCCKEAGLDA